MNLSGRMSREQCQPKTQSARTTLGRCNSKRSNNVIIVDVDRSTVDVIIIDAPESSNQRSRHSGVSLKPNKKCSPSSVISIEDEEDNDDAGFRDAEQNVTSSNIDHPSTAKYVFEESDSDECQWLVGKGEICSESTNWMFDNHYSGFSTSVSDTSEGDMSESGIYETTCSDSGSDCEIMDDTTRNFREDWEKAALKKKLERAYAPLNDGFGTSRSNNEPTIPMCETSQEKIDLVSNNGNIHAVPNKDKVYLNASTSTNGKEEESTLNFMRKSSVDDDLDCTVRADIHGRPSTQNKNEPSDSPDRTQSQPEFPLDPRSESNSFGQDAPVPRCFSCDAWMWHGLNGQSDEISLIYSRDVNESASLFTAEVPGKHQNEDLTIPVNLSPCKTHCPSQHKPEPPSRRVADAAADVSSSHLQAKAASSDLNISLSEHNAAMDISCSSGEEEAVFRGPLGNLMQEDMDPRMIEQSNSENPNAISDIWNDVIEREKHKESKEYRFAEEEEWASRRQQLQIQAEEVEKLRKRKKAKNLRLLDMERRQKQRVEEMRESQKQDEETINIKNQLRAEIRKELEKLEMKYKDMASLLRGLGISVGGGLFPMFHEINVAYRQALLKFHPDRASRTDIREQVESEEKFKLISRLKEKLLTSSY